MYTPTNEEAKTATPIARRGRGRGKGKARGRGK
jgi:hypothetical protein